MNACYLGKKQVKARINRIWSSHPNLGFTGKLKKVVKYYKEYCFQKAKAWKQEERDLRSLVQEVVIKLQVDPRNPTLQTQLGELSNKSQEFEQKTMEGQQIRSRVNWKQFRAQRNFLRQHKSILEPLVSPNLKMWMGQSSLIKLVWENMPKL